MDDYTTKPLKEAELARVLRRCVPARLDPGALADLRELVDDDPAALSGLVEDFLAESPALLDALRAAVAGGDPGQAHRAAHTLRSLGATFGATSMAQLCQEAESHPSETAVAAVVAEHGRVTLALEGLLSRA
jgi:HPt (histidine-containing phosphotransfer) domain-containing protein